LGHHQKCLTNLNPMDSRVYYVYQDARSKSLPSVSTEHSDTLSGVIPRFLNDDVDLDYQSKANHASFFELEPTVDDFACGPNLYPRRSKDVKGNRLISEAS